MTGAGNHNMKEQYLIKNVVNTILLIVFLCFFSGQTIVNTLLPCFDSDFEMVEEMGEGDLDEEEKSDAENKLDEMRPAYLDYLSGRFECSLKITGGIPCSSYACFLGEIPVPPPEV